MNKTRQELDEIISLLIINNEIRTSNLNNSKVVTICNEVESLGNAILQGKRTDNYLLKITTHQGKMKGIRSLSTYKYVSETCLKLKDNKHCICNKCYVDKTLRVYKQVEPTLIYNTLLLRYTELSRRQLPVINELYFRFESFSDLQNHNHLKNLYKIARYNPNTMFGLWSKNLSLLMKEKAPKNVNLILSSPLLNHNFVLADTIVEIVKRKTQAKNVKTFSVYDKDHIGEVDFNCAKQCLSCLKCYKKNDKTQNINELLK